MIDCYDVLNLPPGVDFARVRTRYLRLAKKFHPDKNADPGAQERFIEIQLAYEILSDPATKRLYEMTNDTDGSFTRENFNKFKQRYEDAVDILEKEAAFARDKAKITRKRWEIELEEDRRTYEEQKRSFEAWRSDTFQLLSAMMDKLKAMPDCAAKAQLLQSLQGRIEEIKQGVAEALERSHSLTKTCKVSR